MNKMSKDDKLRILVLGDTGTCATGFGTLLRNILYELAKNKNYDITQIGINFDGDFYDQRKFPYKIYPASPMGQGDLYGLQRLDNVLQGADKNIPIPFDLLITVQDHFIIEQVADRIKQYQKQYKEQGQLMKWIAYYPVDSKVKENWVNTIMKADYPVVYTDFAKRECMEFDYLNPDIEKMRVIYHGVNTQDFYPISEKEKIEFRNQYFKKMKEKINVEKAYIVLNVNRNQERKDMMRSMKAFKEFKKYVPESIYYIHCSAQDVGGNIIEMGRELNMKAGEDFAYASPKYFSANQGYPVETLNKIYNVADLLITTTLGEGWGFSLTEGMATKLPILAPNITSIPEILGSKYNGGLDGCETIEEIENSKKIRGIPVKSGATINDYVYMGTDHERLRPITDIDDMAEKMKWAYYHKDKVREIAERGHKWAKDLTWTYICMQWKNLLEESIKDIKAEYMEMRKEIKPPVIIKE